MNKHTIQREISHTSGEGEDERRTNFVSRERYFIESEKQLVTQQQFLKIMTLSFHNSLIKSYRNLLHNSESNKSECCDFRKELLQTILDHESKLAIYFDSGITKSLGLTTKDRNHLTGS